MNATCTLTSCPADNSLGGFGSAFLWFSHVTIGISALSYTIAFGLLWDGAANISQLHALDPVLKEKGITTKQKAYEAFANCEDQAVKHMAFWLVSLQRTWGAFQTSIGIGLWVVIFMLPVKHRAPVHFIIGYLQLIVGMIAASLAWGVGLPDLVPKFGGVKPGAVAAEGSKGMPRPANSGVKSDFWSHLVLGLSNLSYGVLCLVMLFGDD